MSTAALLLASLLLPGTAGEAWTGSSPSSAGAGSSRADTASTARVTLATTAAPPRTADSRSIPAPIPAFRPDSSPRSRARGSSPRTLLPAAVVGLAAVSGWDEPVRRGALDLRGEGTGADEAVFDAAERFGAWEVALPAYATAAVGGGVLLEGGEGAKRGVAALAGTAAASAVNEGLNRAVGRARPSREEGAFSFDAFGGHASFPSGHTAFAFAAAAGLDAVTEGWIPAAAGYGIASMTGLSRVYHDRHWLTDVAAGAALGTAVSYLTARQALRALGVEEGGKEAREERAGRTSEAAGDATLTRLVADPVTGVVGVRLVF